jgi:DNA-binding MarR family transcriptional regulator
VIRVAAKLGGTLKTKALNQLKLVLETITEGRDRHMNAAEMLAFIHVALHHPTLTQKDLAGRIGIAQSETSRIVSLFMEYGLFASQEDPHERRRKIVSLTPMGRKLRDQIRSHMGEEVD